MRILEEYKSNYIKELCVESYLDTIHFVSEKYFK